MKNEIVIFENQNVKLEVNMKGETVWLSANQMAELFGRDYKTIRKHINNALNEELDDSTVAKFATVQKEGKSNLQKMQIANSDKPVKIYSLDVIIGVGYE